MTDVSQLDYKLLSRTDPHFLAEDVAEWTARGYKLAGGVAVYMGHDSKPVFVQAVAAELE